MKHVLNCASLDSVTRISANCVLSLSNRIYQYSVYVTISPVKAYKLKAIIIGIKKRN